MGIDTQIAVALGAKLLDSLMDDRVLRRARIDRPEPLESPRIPFEHALRAEARAFDHGEALLVGEPQAAAVSRPAGLRAPQAGDDPRLSAAGDVLEHHIDALFAAPEKRQVTAIGRQTHVADLRAGQEGLASDQRGARLTRGLCLRFLQRSPRRGDRVGGHAGGGEPGGQHQDEGDSRYATCSPAKRGQRTGLCPFFS